MRIKRPQRFRIIVCASLAVTLFVGTLTISGRMWPQMTPKQTVQGLRAAEGLEVTLWAAEPDVINPTNIDIDFRGRIWVLEGVNYRLTLDGRKGKDHRPVGDRITILEDTDGDGRADKTKVFVQDLSLRSPLGIAVLGNKVIVSQSPDLIVYAKDEQDNILKKEILLTGWRGVDHDHGLHAVVFGPDGRLYFNNGDQGLDVLDKSGKHIVSSREGPFYAGTALRMNPDGTNLTVLGHNFRNPYELAVDSFGNVWQTDNDDDGNAWVRVNFVMEGGNFGYWGPGGRSWTEDKGSHFHSELPGVVPNMLRTGAGAPCGLVVYEGKLLPRQYRGMMIHAEAGARAINTYFIQPEGAGYSAQVLATVSGTDTWFRPSDVCVAPDGAVFISDWYDPAVGGHQMADTKRGRIYRLAPPGYKTQKPVVDLEKPAGLTQALDSPAQSIRYLAFTRLKEQGPAALPLLLSILKQEDPILKARALWLLGGIQGEGEAAVRSEMMDVDSNFRMLALRILRLYDKDVPGAIRELRKDRSPQVRREIALALQYLPSEQALEPLLALCKKYDGRDRWMLEALGIGARGRESLLYPKLREAFPDSWNSLLGQLLWEFRPAEALPELISNFKNESLTIAQRLEVLQALSAQTLPAAGVSLAEFVTSNDAPQELVSAAFQRLNQQLYSEAMELRKNSLVIAAVKKALKTSTLQVQALELAVDLENSELGPELLALAKSTEVSAEARGLAIVALGRTQNEKFLAELERISQAESVELRVLAVGAIGYIKPKGLEEQMKRLVLSQAPNEVRAEAVRVLGRSDRGCIFLLDMEQSSELPSELRRAATGVTHANHNPLIKSRAQKLLPALTSKNRKPLPPIRELIWREGDAERGRKVYELVSGPKCKSCHSLDEAKRSVGPNLSAIGKKLGKEGLLDSILNPSNGIAPEYFVWILRTKREGDVTGILLEDTSQRVVIRTDANEEFRLKPSEIISRRRSRLSLMPEDLAGTMTEQQLVDLLEFLTTLKKDTHQVSSTEKR